MQRLAAHGARGGAEVRRGHHVVGWSAATAGGANPGEGSGWRGGRLRRRGPAWAFRRRIERSGGKRRDSRQGAYGRWHGLGRA